MRSDPTGHPAPVKLRLAESGRRSFGYLNKCCATEEAGISTHENSVLSMKENASLALSDTALIIQGTNRHGELGLQVGTALSGGALL